jgi:hypothetical protein
MSLPAVGAPRVPYDEGMEKPVFQTSLPEFCRFRQKEWLWVSLHYFHERDRNFVKETLSRANRNAYSHIHTFIRQWQGVAANFPHP